MEKQSYSFRVSILLCKEGSGEDSGWVAQCLEYDITAQGKTIQDAKKAFGKTFVGQILVDLKHGKAPLQGIKKAPKEYWDKWNVSEQLADHRQPFYLPDNIPPAFVIHAAATDMRVCS